MSNKKVSINETNVSLLAISAGEMLAELPMRPELRHLRQNAFDYYNENTKEYYQVHVTVTRDEGDFLEAFQTEEMS